MPGPDFSLVFPPDPVWVRSAREAVRALLRSARRDDLTDTALLLTSEAVTNAVNACHSSGCSIPVTLSAEWTGRGTTTDTDTGRDACDTLRVLVHDFAPGLPAGRAAEGGDESGRGLALIGDCATDWGVRPTDAGPGKSVWFEL
ncbi:ATP-binding protein [Streptomyces sp. RKAG337]|uniref:ATP-binding protein n=1 Tax=Streptomyces sp. RKAG337 TaxID=2893404 RepID=UPI00203422B2|nr:ATP-binding protein [Streptomyces sp. RKAG337]MCM2426840.1 ATP-binding protein [Streptomyces sp. RKAG337]